MQAVPFPRITYPFSYGINPYTTAVDAYTINWAVNHALIRDQETLERYQKMKLNALVGRMFYTAGFDALRLIADYNFLFFIMDDQCNMLPRGRKKDYWQRNVAALTPIMEDNHKISYRNGSNFAAAFSNAWERTQDAADKQWRAWFAETIKAYFQARIWEAANFDAGVPPSHMTAAHFNICAITYVENVLLPYEVYQHPVVRQLMELPARIVCWVNDLFSLGPEMKLGDMHNIVILLQQERGLSPENAIAEALKVHDEDLAQYLRTEQQLPVFGDETDKELARYITFLRALISGNVEWSRMDTNRYYC